VRGYIWTKLKPKVTIATLELRIVNEATEYLLCAFVSSHVIILSFRFRRYVENIYFR
jgi:hypothetical protein